MSENYKNVYIDLHVKYLLFLSECNERWIFFTAFQKNTQTSRFLKTHSVGGELFHADKQSGRQTDMTKLIVAFAILWTRPKICAS